MEIFFTVVAGTMTFVAGQVALKILIEPVHMMKNTISEISHDLILYANIYANPKALGIDEHQDNALKKFRMLSSKLQADMALIPAYKWICKFFGLPTIQNIRIASSSLIGLSNGHDAALNNQGILNCYSAQKVKLALGIYIDKSELMDPDKERKFISAKEGTR